MSTKKPAQSATARGATARAWLRSAESAQSAQWAECALRRVRSEQSAHCAACEERACAASLQTTLSITNQIPTYFPLREQLHFKNTLGQYYMKHEPGRRRRRRRPLLLTQIKTIMDVLKNKCWV